MNMNIFITFKKINAVFCIRQLIHCTGVPQARGMFPWGFAPAERLKTTGLDQIEIQFYFSNPLPNFPMSLSR